MEHLGGVGRRSPVEHVARRKSVVSRPVVRRASVSRPAPSGREAMHLRAWSSFLPNIVLEQLSGLAPLVGDGELEAEAELAEVDGLVSVFEAAALFADASGFTALTERLAKLPDGAERMCSAMNGFLTRMIACVHEHGGDVLKFAGDAVSCVFPVGDDGGTPEAAAARATACALELHRRVHGFVAWRDPSDGTEFTLSLHIGVGVGQVTMLHLGGHMGRCELVYAGPPISQSAAAEPQAETGETCVSPEVWAMVGDVLKLEAKPAPGSSTAAAGERFMLVVAAAAPMAPAAAALHGLVAPPAPMLREAMLPYLRRYVPLAAAIRMHAMGGGRRRGPLNSPRCATCPSCLCSSRACSLRVVPAATAQRRRWSGGRQRCCRCSRRSWRMRGR